MIRVLFGVIFSLNVGCIWAQTNGDYQSDQAGNWSTSTTWEVFFNGAWRDLETVAAGGFRNVIPSNVSGIITVKHAVLVNLNTTTNQTIVDPTGVLTVFSGRTLIIQDDALNTPLLIAAGGTLVNNGILDLQTQMTSTPCQVLGTLSSNSVINASNPLLLIFQAGSTYINFNRTGGRVPSATWDINSTCRISGLTITKPVPPANLAQSFGNFEWNAPGMGASLTFSLGGALQDVRGNLRFVSTGSTGTAVRLGNGGAGANLAVGGNFIMEGGSVILAQGFTSASTITIGGNLEISDGSLRLGNSNGADINVLLNGNFVKTGGTLFRGSGTGVGTIRFNGGTQTYSNNAILTDAVGFSVQNGSTLDLGSSSFLTGTGAFTLLSGGTINVGSTDANGAVQLGTLGGNIRMGGTRTYQAGSTVNYNGSGAQFMGNGHPANSNTLISNPIPTTMVSNATVNGVLNILAGGLLVQNNTLTLGGSYLRTGGTIGVSTASSLVINGTGNFSDLLVSFTEFPGNPINNLTINRTGGTVFLGNNLIVAGVFTQTAGNFSLGQFNPFALTIRGPFSQTAGSFLVFNSSTLIIDGAGVLPANVNIVGPDLGTLTMDRVGRTFTTNSNFTVTNLNLFNGVVNNAGFNISMASNGVVTRRSGGSITQPLGIDSPDNFHVVYDVATDIVTGNELPFILPENTRLGNLTKRGVATVSLNHPIRVNGTFIIEAGTFNADGDPITITRNMDIQGTFVPGPGVVTFAGNGPQTVLGTGPVDFYDLALSQSSSSTLDIQTPVNVTNSLSVTSSSIFDAGAGLVTLVSNATGTANVAPIAAGGSIIGDVNVQRFLPKAVLRAEYYHLSSPVVNSTFANWTDDVPISSRSRWNEPTRRYATAPSVHVAGAGYVVDVKTTSTPTIQTTGPLRQGNVSIGVTTRTPGVVAGPDGWNLIGNPYPSAIDWDNITINTSQVYNAVYMYDNFGNSGQGTGIGIVVSYVDDVGTPASFGGEIAQGQAFWVKALQNSSITFTESAKTSVTNTTVFRKKEVPNVLRIKIIGDGVNDETVVRLREGATENFDGKYDAYKYLTNDFNISTLTSDNIKAVINAFGTSSCNRNIPLVTEGAKAGSFTLNFAGIDSFDPAVSVSLVDKHQQKTIDIRDQQSYAFTITDENLADLSDRFEISIGSHAQLINTSIVATGESLCADQDIAKVTLESSEPGIAYSVDWNGSTLSDPVMGTGSSIELIVRASSLTLGENELTVLASSGICSTTSLNSRPVIARFQRGEVSSVTHGGICIDGFATLKAAGANDENSYRWYASVDDVESIAGQSSSTFVTPHLNKSKTYYVATMNALGCEGNRVPVHAVVSYPENVDLITSNEGLLVSSSKEGNQWYLNGQLLEGHTSNTLEPFKSGLYTVEVHKGSCATSASLEVTGLGEGGITIFPNPTADKVVIRVNTANNNAVVTLVSSQGVEIGRKELSGGASKEAEFDLLPFAPGIYHVRILDGQKLTNKKIAKIK